MLSLDTLCELNTNGQTTRITQLERLYLQTFLGPWKSDERLFCSGDSVQCTRVQWTVYIWILMTMAIHLRTSVKGLSLSFHHITSPYVSLHHITSRYISLDYIIHYFKLHYIYSNKTKIEENIFLWSRKISGKQNTQSNIALQSTKNVEYLVWKVFFLILSFEAA